MKKDPILRIYEAAIPVFGKSEARKYAMQTLESFIYELEEAGKLTDETLHKALTDHAEWSVKAAEKALKEKNQDVA